MRRGKKKEVKSRGEIAAARSTAILTIKAQTSRTKRTRM